MRYCAAALLVAAVLLLPAVCYAEIPYRTYTYDFWGEPVPSPQAYLPSQVITGSQMGAGDFRNPQDLFVSQAGRIYIADSGHDRVVCVDRDWNFLYQVDTFDNHGTQDRLANPYGVFVTQDEHLWVADRDHGRVVVFDQQGAFVREIGGPTADAEGIIPANFQYRPNKLGVDGAGRLYVLAEEVFDGLLVFDAGGQFRGFIGAPRVAPNPLDVLWQRVATEEQRQRQMLFLPTEFSNIAVEERGFILATVPPGSAGQDQSVRKLNPAGRDVLIRGGIHPVIGDVKYLPSWAEASFTGRSVFVDAAPHSYGIYSVLDQRRGRIFTYNDTGRLLFAFGGLGTQQGLLRNPVAMDILDKNILVLDSRDERITVYAPTEYARSIFRALEHYHRGEYGRSDDAWREVLRLNANYDEAYTGIGRALFRSEQYAEAMMYFRYGNNRTDYSRALSYYRREVVGDHFGLLVYSALALALAVYVIGRLQRKRVVTHKRTPKDTWLAGLARSLQYALHVVFHPFDGFWDLKYERRGSLSAALIILFSVVVSYVFMRQYTGFIFNPRDLSSLNILVEAASVVLPFILWSAVNWALTTLMDGKGSLRDIVIYSAYALTPLVLINVPMTVISSYITLEEGAFYYFLLSLGVGWSMALMLLGTMVTHEYDMNKTALTILGVAAGMGFSLFLGLLGYSIAELLVTFVRGLYTEIVFRL